MCPVDETSGMGHREKTSIVPKLVTILTTVAVAIMLLSTMTFAAELAGTVSAVDEKGIAAIKTTDDKELQVQMAGVEGRG
jgi:hypothetical protein